MEAQPGVNVQAQFHDHHVSTEGLGGATDMNRDVSDVTPGAVLPSGANPAAGMDIAAAGTDGHLVDPQYQTGVQDMTGTATVPGAKDIGNVAAVTDHPSSEYGAGAGAPPTGAHVVADVNQTTRKGDVEPKKKGFMAKVKDAIM
jgi:hypothetical protein